MAEPSRRGQRRGWYHEVTSPADPDRRPGLAAGPVSAELVGPGLAGPRGGLVRPVRPVELPALVELDGRIFGQLAYPFFVLRQFHDVHDDDLLVVEEHGRLVGYSLGVCATTAGLGWILGLGVDPDARGHGYGELLARATFARLTLRGVRRVRLTVRGENDVAAGLYGKLGFEPVCEVADYLGPGESRVVLEARLPLLDGLNGTADALPGDSG
jgi:ribosomal protein S18 acetylase RimI-like enzyme